MLILDPDHEFTIVIRRRAAGQKGYFSYGGRRCGCTFNGGLFIALFCSARDWVKATTFCLWSSQVQSGTDGSRRSPLFLTTSFCLISRLHEMYQSPRDGTIA